MVIAGVVNEVPDPNEVPPVAEVNQFNVPALAVAESTTVPASQRELGVTLVTVGGVLTVATTGVLDEVQPKLVAST